MGGIWLSSPLEAGHLSCLNNKNTNTPIAKRRAILRTPTMIQRTGELPPPFWLPVSPLPPPPLVVFVVAGDVNVGFGGGGVGVGVSVDGGGVAFGSAHKIENKRVLELLVPVTCDWDWGRSHGQGAHSSVRSRACRPPFED